MKVEVQFRMPPVLLDKNSRERYFHACFKTSGIFSPDYLKQNMNADVSSFSVISLSTIGQIFHDNWSVM